MGLSSNILWHQTNKESLKMILKQKRFRYSYSVENIKAIGYTLECAFPMISMCDIPFADISSYLNKYGGNSIGLSREWGIKHGINPVIYCEPTSSILNDIGKIISSTEDENVQSCIWELLSHIKNHEGVLPKYKYKRYRFYDEREVRLIPTKENLLKNKICPILLKNKYDEYKKINKVALLPESLNAPFEYTDIRYFILKDEKSIAEIKQILSNELDLRTERINFFTIRQIEEDFIGENHNENFNIERTNLTEWKGNIHHILGKINLNK